MSNYLEGLLIVGAGRMGKEYGRVLNALGSSYKVVSRSKGSADSFKKVTGVEAYEGGLEEYIAANKANCPRRAIVTVNVEYLKDIAILLLKWGVTEILLEKPGALNVTELKELQQIAEFYPESSVYIGYNRRFYQSTQYILQQLNQEEMESIHFNFTEIAHAIENSAFSSAVKYNWLLANSSHVIDLAFFMAGFPFEIKHIRADSLVWHPRGAIFVGCGVTERDVLFSYHANWLCPGRWGIEIMTKYNKYIMMPLERVFVQRKGDFNIEEVILSNQLDVQYKAGVYNQTRSFLGDKRYLVTIDEQIRMAMLLDQILE